MEGEEDANSRLLTALLSGKLEKFCSLLDRGIVNPMYFYEEPQNGTILEIACRYPEYSDFVKELLKRGINCNGSILEASRRGNYKGLQELLADKTTNVNSINNDGLTALHLIARNFSDDCSSHVTESFKMCITLLVTCPTFNVNRMDKRGLTAIHKAVICCHRRAVNMILKSCRNADKDLDLDSNRVNGSTAREAISSKFPELVYELPTPKPQPAIFEMRLLWALETGDLEHYRRLLLDATEEGFDPNHWFKQPYNTRCLEIACKMNGADFVEATLNAGADPNCINLVSQKTPLHVAVEAGNTAAVKVLLDSEQIEINAKDVEGKTPLHIAASMSNIDECHFKCLELLLDARNISFNIVDNSGKTPADETDNEDIRRLITSKMPEFSDIAPRSAIVKRMAVIIPHKEPPIKKYFDLLIQEDYAGFLKKIENLELHDDILNSHTGSYTLLQYACEKGLHEIVNKLLTKVDPNRTSPKNSRTPLMIACSQGDTKMVEILLSSAAKTKLDVNKKDCKENTALHYAAKKEDLATVGTLLKHGADTGVRNMFGRLPLMPEETKILLDKSLTSEKNYLPSHDKYAINFDYKLLISSVSKKVFEHECKPCSENNIQEDMLISEAGQCWTRPGGRYSEMRFLYFLSQSPEHHDLLKHPLITSFLHVKTTHARNLSNWNIAFVVLFVLFLNVIICLQVSNVAKDLLWLFMMIKCVTFVLTILLLVRELLQCGVKSKLYVRNPENIMDILLIILSLLLLLETPMDVFLPWAQVGGILLSWLELLLVTGRTHYLCNNLEMLKTVCVNYFFTLRSYIFIIIAFSLSFYVIFANAQFPDDKINGNFFSNPLLTLFKTIIMMTGEFESGDIAFISNIWLSTTVFTLFVFFLPVVLMNLLTALAVSDEQHIRRNANILSIISTIKRLYEIENITAYFWGLSKRLKCHRITKSLEKVWLFPEGTCRNSYLRLWPNRGAIFQISSQNKVDAIHKLDPELVEEAKEILQLRVEDAETKSEAQQEVLAAIARRLELLEDSFTELAQQIQMQLKL